MVLSTDVQCPSKKPCVASINSKFPFTTKSPCFGTIEEDAFNTCPEKS